MFVIGAEGIKKLEADAGLSPGTVVISRHSGHRFIIMDAEPTKYGQRAIRDDGERTRDVSANDLESRSPIARLDVDTDADPYTAEQLAALEALAEEKVNERRYKANEKERQNDENEKKGRAYLREHAPANAKAFLLAEYRVDQSDSMTDYSGSTTRQTVLLDWSTHTRDLFPEMRKAAARMEETAHLETAPEKAEHREKYSMGGGYYLKDGYRHSTGWSVKKYSQYKSDKGRHPAEWVPRDVAQAIGESADNYRAPKKGEGDGQQGTAPQLDAPPEGVHVEEYSEKALVVRGDTKPIKDELKAIGGKFNPRLKGGPGWIFSKKKADKIDALLAAEPQPVTTSSDGPSVNVDTLRKNAKSLRQKAERKRPSRDQNPTPKRTRQWAQSDHEAADMERAAAALDALADAHEAGTVPPALADITTQKEAKQLTATRADTSGGYYSYVPTGEPRDTGEKAEALRAFLSDAETEEEKAEREAKAEAAELARMVDDLAGTKIPGFFPTPAAVSERMIDRLDLSPGCSVLEPSAGSGNLADAIKAAEPEAKIKTVEQNYTLCEILAAKGYNPDRRDFTDYAREIAAPRFDAVIMNPPFENRQDAEHIQLAYSLLKPGGTLAAVCGNGVFFGSDKKAQAFRAWLDDVAADVEELPEGSFQGTGEVVQTGVSARLVFIDKPDDGDDEPTEEPADLPGEPCEPANGYAADLIPAGYPRQIAENTNNPHDPLRAVAYGPERADVEAKSKHGHWFGMKSKAGEDAHARAIEDCTQWYPAKVTEKPAPRYSSNPDLFNPGAQLALL